MTDQKHDLEQLEKMATNLRIAATEKKIHILILIDTGEELTIIGNPSVPKSFNMLKNAAVALAQLDEKDLKQVLGN